MMNKVCLSTREAEQSTTMAVKIKRKPKGSLRWVSSTKDYVYATSTIVVAIHDRKTIVKRRSTITKQNRVRPELYIKQNEVLTIGQKETPLRYISLLKRELPESSLGWPMLQKPNANSSSKEAMRISEAKKMSVVQWVMSLPTRSGTVISKNQVDFDSNKDYKCPDYKETNRQLVKASLHNSTEDSKSTCSSISPSCPNERLRSKLGWPLLQNKSLGLADSEAKANSFSNNTENPQIPKNVTNEKCPLEDDRLQLLNKVTSLDCRVFNYAELETATFKFSSENLIGQGGFSNVYKGCLSNEEFVAIKILKPYNEAWTDFSLELDILSSVKNKHIATLQGVCIENGHLITVYNFFPKGSLDQNLHGHEGTFILPWKGRFNVALAVAEALNYLHNECARPIIHRDIKSSNILITNDLLPKLSDFGLAIWGSRDSASGVDGNVVGTFGYMAPEYFMSGIVSDKVDVYAFGVVLLELLSGRKPIGDKLPKGQQSLVKWAEHILEKGDPKALLDTKLNEDFDVAQLHRMALAARLCITQSTRFRPNINQIAKLLRGKMDAKELVKYRALKESGSENDYKPVFNSICRVQQPEKSSYLKATSHSDTTQLTIAKKTHRPKLRDLLQEQD